MKKSFFILLLLGLAITFSAFSFDGQALQYNTLLTINNQTGQNGYIGICAQPITPETQSLCSIPEKINQGSNQIFVPKFKTAYLVFTTEDESTYACGTPQSPNQQLFLPITSAYHTVILGPFIQDKTGQNIAINCAMQ